MLYRENLKSCNDTNTHRPHGISAKGGPGPGQSGWGAVGNVRTGQPRGCWETTEWAWSPWQRNWPKQFEATGNQVTGNEQ